MDTIPTIRVDELRYELLVCLLGKLTSSILSVSFTEESTDQIEICVVAEYLNDHVNQDIEDLIDDFEAYHPAQFKDLRFVVRDPQASFPVRKSHWHHAYIRGGFLTQPSRYHIAESWPDPTAQPSA